MTDASRVIRDLNLGPAKRLFYNNAVVRDVVRAHRLRNGQPDWTGLLQGQQSPSALSKISAQSGRRVLLATVGGGYLAGTTVESLLALALSLRGAEVHVLLCDGVMPACLECNSDWYPNRERFAGNGPTGRHCNACFEPANRMYESLGITVHRYSNLITARQAEEARLRASTIEPSELRDYVADKVRIGEHANSGALRFFARASMDDEPTGESVLRRYFEAALLTKSATEALFDTGRFDCAVSHHGIYVPQGVIGDVARQRDVAVVNWHVAYRRSCFIFSHGDTYHHTLLNEPVSEWEGMPWSDAAAAEISDYLKSRWSGEDDWITFHHDPQFQAEAIASATGVDFSKTCIGMLTNVMWDAQLHYPANAFPSMLAWADATIAYFARRPELELLIRVHPAEVSGTLRSKQPFLAALSETWPVLPRNVHVIPPESSISTYAAMEMCNAVLIYGTKMGVELAATGMPVVVAGEAWVRNKGITRDAGSLEAYHMLLDSLPAERLTPDVQERALKYAYHFFFRRMIPLDFARQARGIPGFSWELEELSQLLPGANSGLDVICDGILEKTPFIYPAEDMLQVPSGPAAGL